MACDPGHDPVLTGWVLIHGLRGGNPPQPDGVELLRRGVLQTTGSPCMGEVTDVCTLPHTGTSTS